MESTSVKERFFCPRPTHASGVLNNQPLSIYAPILNYTIHSYAACVFKQGTALFILNYASLNEHPRGSECVPCGSILNSYVDLLLLLVKGQCP